MPDLKPGTLCWLTKTIPENNGKIVEVIQFKMQTPLGKEVYECKSRIGEIIIETQAILGSGKVMRLGQRQPWNGSEPMYCWRDQLIPINNPDMDIQVVEEQLKSLPLTRI